MMVASYSIAGDVFTPSTARAWSESTFSPTPPVNTYGPSFDIHPDGQRFAVAPLAALAESGQRPQMVLVFNFFEELRRLAPAK
jgi:hypothetical protein